MIDLNILFIVLGILFIECAVRLFVDLIALAIGVIICAVRLLWDLIDYLF